MALSDCVTLTCVISLNIEIQTLSRFEDQSVVFMTFTHMLKLDNVYKHTTFYSSLLETQYVRQCVHTNIKSRSLSIYGVHMWNLPM